MSNMLRIAAAHSAPNASRTEYDLSAIEAIVAKAAGQADLVLLPELAALPFFPPDDPQNWTHVAEPLDGASTSAAAALADKYGIAIIFPFVLRQADGCKLNAVALLEPGHNPRLVATKIHIPPKDKNDRFGEADHFAPGEPVITPFQVAGVSCVVLICFDRRFPETWRAARSAGAELVLIPVAGPSDEPDEYFLCELRTHARENGLYAVSSARVGQETVAGRSYRHSGSTAATDPFGNVVGSLSPADEPGLLIAQFSREKLEEARKLFPYFETRRTLSTPRHQ